jgi:hypothetical protein
VGEKILGDNTSGSFGNQTLMVQGDISSNHKNFETVVAERMSGLDSKMACNYLSH